MMVTMTNFAGLRPHGVQPDNVRMEERERVERIVAAAQETKAEDIVVYDVRGHSTVTDYVLICSGRSQAHVRGVVDKVEETLKKAGIRAGALEGYQEGSWVLMDYDVIIVHVFHPETRAFYDLDGLLEEFPQEQFVTPGGEAEGAAEQSYSLP